MLERILRMLLMSFKVRYHVTVYFCNVLVYDFTQSTCVIIVLFIEDILNIDCRLLFIEFVTENNKGTERGITLGTFPTTIVMGMILRWMN